LSKKYPVVAGKKLSQKICPSTKQNVHYTKLVYHTITLQKIKSVVIDDGFSLISAMFFAITCPSKPTPKF